MQVSKREEALARELYEHDMGIAHGYEVFPWENQIEKVQTSYRRQAAVIVGTRWFKKIEKMLREADSDNRVS